jgi:hypothetical protein
MDELEPTFSDAVEFEREPTAIERAFFTPLYNPRSAWQVLGWWESRRFLYNTVVGGAGVITVAAAALLGGAGVPPLTFLIVPLVYGVAANACYTLGWVADLTLRKWLGRRADFAGPALLRYGFVFSIGLTLLPIPLMAMSWLVRTFLLRQ